MRRQRATATRAELAEQLADWLAEREGSMGGKSNAARLHRLSALQVQTAGNGDEIDGGGLLLRVREGRASWVYRYTAPSGKRREMGLDVAHRGSRAQAGNSLTSARDLAHRQRELLRQGIDPLVIKAEQRGNAQAAEVARKAERQRDHWTLARAARDYHERTIEPSRTAKHAAQWIASLENHLPAELWHKPVGNIAAPDLLAALGAIKPHERARNLKGERLHETTRRIRQRLEAVFEDAVFHGRVSTNPAAAVRRKLRETQPARIARGKLAALPYAEAPALMQRLRDVPGTAARALELAVMTASRTGEVVGATWGELDLSAAVWTVAAERMKAKEAHTVYLSPRALAILQAQAGHDERWVFPSPTPKADGTSRPLSNMALLAVLGRLGMRQQTTVHGLCRATFSTWANETGAARPDAVEACLAHKEGNLVRAAYNRAHFADERRALLAAWADYLARPAAPVVELQRGAA
jgi:integrase